MRVIGGRSRGRRLKAKLPTTIRPTSDRVRESIFDILGSQGGVEGLDVIDLFCGSGALGVEALSRGAATATFIDQDPGALAAVRQNLEAVGLDDANTTLVGAELPGWLRTPAARDGGAFDLVLCDPPYNFAGWAGLLTSLQEIGTDMVVMESSSTIALPEGWMLTRERRYGGTLVTVAQSRTEPHAEGGAGA
ncbi:MAG TPA: 16S rRNA (guanine(966)-N(2))-methyltransferase RsmD [Acidimicrobiales bacterium]|nr:16S rRNA (guanine(966)-N(2))-methyltransferase RsmD [Acidimicrobiales bacterium]